MIPFRDVRLGDTQAYTGKCRKVINEGHDDFIVMAMDNNQRGQRRKQQRHGISNSFMVVTHSVAIKPTINTSKEKLVSLSTSRIKIKYFERVTLHA